jgi:hypothetical protein
MIQNIQDPPRSWIFFGASDRRPGSSRRHQRPPQLVTIPAAAAPDPGTIGYYFSCRYSAPVTKIKSIVRTLRQNQRQGRLRQNQDQGRLRQNRHGQAGKTARPDHARTTETTGADPAGKDRPAGPHQKHRDNRCGQPENRRLPHHNRLRHNRHARPGRASGPARHRRLRQNRRSAPGDNGRTPDRRASHQRPLQLETAPAAAGADLDQVLSPIGDNKKHRCFSLSPKIFGDNNFLARKLLSPMPWRLVTKRAAPGAIDGTKCYGVIRSGDLVGLRHQKRSGRAAARPVLTPYLTLTEHNPATPAPRYNAFTLPSTTIQHHAFTLLHFEIETQPDRASYRAILDTCYKTMDRGPSAARPAV